MNEKIPVEARHDAVGREILGVGLGCGTVPMAGRDIACRAGEMWSPVRAGMSHEGKDTSPGAACRRGKGNSGRWAGIWFCSHDRQGYSLLGRWDVEPQFGRV